MRFPSGIGTNATSDRALRGPRFPILLLRREFGEARGAEFSLSLGLRFLPDKLPAFRKRPDARTNFLHLSRVLASSSAALDKHGVVR